MAGDDEGRRLEWTHVAARLWAERTLWVGTVGPDGAPHAAPVWLAVLADEAFVFTSGTSAKARNLRRNPDVVLHSEDGEDVLIVFGQLRFVGHPLEHPDVMARFAEKYQEPGDADFLPDREASADSLYRLDPSRAMTWDLVDFQGSQRRWSAT